MPLRTTLLALVCSILLLAPAAQAQYCGHLRSVTPWFDENCFLNIDVEVRDFDSCEAEQPGGVEIRVMNLDALHPEPAMSMRSACAYISEANSTVWTVGPIRCRGWRHARIEVWVHPPDDEPIHCHHGNLVPDLELAIAADLDCNGRVDTLDLIALLMAWGEADHAADLDRDGRVNIGDLLLMLEDLN
jgi:hypothetical protein